MKKAKRIEKITEKEYKFLEDDGIRMMKASLAGQEYHEAKKRLFFISHGRLFV